MKHTLIENLRKAWWPSYDPYPPAEYEFVPKPKDYTSHSGLNRIKEILFGKPPFSGAEMYMIFGRVLHTRLEGKKSDDEKLLSAEDKQHLKNVLKAVKKHKEVQRLIKGTEIEHRIVGAIQGVKIKVIIDRLKVKQHVLDWKTTTCKTKEEFFKKAVEFDYFRQGDIYQKVGEVNSSVFVGLQKNAKPYNIFPLWIHDYPEELLYAQKELDFLLYYFKHYGIPKTDSAVGKNATKRDTKADSNIKRRGVSDGSRRKAKKNSSIAQRKSRRQKTK